MSIDPSFSGGEGRQYTISVGVEGDQEAIAKMAALEQRTQQFSRAIQDVQRAQAQAQGVYMPPAPSGMQRGAGGVYAPPMGVGPLNPNPAQAPSPLPGEALYRGAGLPPGFAGGMGGIAAPTGYFQQQQQAEERARLAQERVTMAGSGVWTSPFDPNQAQRAPGHVERASEAVFRAAHRTGLLKEQTPAQAEAERAARTYFGLEPASPERHAQPLTEGRVVSGPIAAPRRRPHRIHPPSTEQLVRWAQTADQHQLYRQMSEPARTEIESHLAASSRITRQSQSIAAQARQMAQASQPQGIMGNLSAWGQQIAARARGMEVPATPEQTAARQMAAHAGLAADVAQEHAETARTVAAGSGMTSHVQEAERHAQRAEQAGRTAQRASAESQGVWQRFSGRLGRVREDAGESLSQSSLGRFWSWANTPNARRGPGSGSPIQRFGQGSTWILPQESFFWASAAQAAFGSPLITAGAGLGVAAVGAGIGLAAHVAGQARAEELLGAMGGEGGAFRTPLDATFATDITNIGARYGLDRNASMKMMAAMQPYNLTNRTQQSSALELGLAASQSFGIDQQTGVQMAAMMQGQLGFSPAQAADQITKLAASIKAVGANAQSAASDVVTMGAQMQRGADLSAIPGLSAYASQYGMTASQMFGDTVTASGMQRYQIAAFSGIPVEQYRQNEQTAAGQALNMQATRARLLQIYNQTGGNLTATEIVAQQIGAIGADAQPDIATQGWLQNDPTKMAMTAANAKVLESSQQFLQRNYAANVQGQGPIERLRLSMQTTGNVLGFLAAPSPGDMAAMSGLNLLQQFAYYADRVGQIEGAGPGPISPKSDATNTYVTGVPGAPPGGVHVYIHVDQNGKIVGTTTQTATATGAQQPLAGGSIAQIPTPSPTTR